MFKNELAFRNHDNALKVAKALLDEDYVVLLSYEDSLLIVDYEWSENEADRNDVVFMPKYEYQEELENHYDEIMTEIKEDIKEGYITSLDFFYEYEDEKIADFVKERNEAIDMAIEALTRPEGGGVEDD